jgi:hypothetical protein
VIVPIAMHVEPVQVGDQWWIDVAINDHKLKRQGPFKNADAAKTAADRFIQNWQPKTPAVPAKNDMVVLFGKPVELTSDEGRRFVADACRAAEGLIEDSELRTKYEIVSDADLKAISENPALIKAIRDERARRVRNSVAAREAAQRHFVKTPAVMDSIMSDQNANPRHRIEAAREIRATATSGGDAENARDTERFVIRIDLSAAPDGGEVLEISKDITPKPPQPMVDGEVVGEQE